jgi:hypothetical protein
MSVTTVAEAVDVCVSSTPVFDEACFLCWVAGVDPGDAAERVPQRSGLVFRRQRDDYQRLLSRLHVFDQYRNFDILKHFISQPDLLQLQNLVPVSRDLVGFITDRYYALDDTVAREVVSKQRLTKSRKDLEDLSNATACNFKSVARQFENLKRVFLDTEENCVNNVQSYVRDKYMLSPELSRQYSCLVFLVSCGFALGAKKRMARVSCQGLVRCAALTMACLVADASVFSLCCAATEEGEASSLSQMRADRNDAVSMLLLNTCPLGMTAEEAWGSVWRCVRTVNNIEGIDKQLQQHLSRVRALISAPAVLDAGLMRVRVELGDAVGILMVQGRVKPVVRDVIRDLVSIGSQLSQTRE